MFERFQKECPCKSAYTAYNDLREAEIKYQCRLYSAGLSCDEKNCPFMAFAKIMAEKVSDSQFFFDEQESDYVSS